MSSPKSPRSWVGTSESVFWTKRRKARRSGGRTAQLRLEPLEQRALLSAVRPLPGFEEFALEPNDDASSSQVDLGFEVNFFGQGYDGLYVNNNGNITFGEDLLQYTPTSLTDIEAAIIAPFWADVDTRGSGTVTYGTDVIDGRGAFGVTWHEVGFFEEHEAPTNTLQLVIIDRSDVEPGAFDIEFNYDTIQWETGDAGGQWETGDAGGGEEGLGGFSARAGFSAGTGVPGSFYELIGSGTNGAFLDSNLETGLVGGGLNSQEPGRYVFEVRAGSMLDEFGLAGQALSVGEGGVFLGKGIHPDDLRIRESFNADAADTTNADQLWPGGGLGLNLDGAGLTVGVWDEGAVRASHQEFEGRVTVVDATAESHHSTHVAGTIGAAGLNAQAQGMAESVAIRSRDWNDDTAEMAADAPLIDVSNHSYGLVRGWRVSGGRDAWIADRATQPDEDPSFGVYDAGAGAVDAVIYNNPNLLSVWSAGNDRNDAFTNTAGDNLYQTWMSTGFGGNPTAGWYLVPNAGATAAPPSDGNGGTGYDSLVNGGGQTAKNTLVVGAINDLVADPISAITLADVAGFSSWGSTDDGRIGVDVVGNGVGLTSSAAGADDAYAQMSGTSMAAPNVAGTAVLLNQHYQNLYGAVPGAATQKAVIIHNAVDAWNAGPDYVFGWGLVDGAASANFLSRTANPLPGEVHLLTEATYSGTEQTYTVEITQGEPLKVTMVWTDPAGTAQTGLDNRTAVLVHDLDLTVTGPGGTYLPWTLDVDNPTAAAVRTERNDVDNVEQVFIDAPQSGIYTIRVSHSGGLGEIASQPYSLLLSGRQLTDDPFEPNDTIATATVIGSEPEITLRDLTIPDADDVDFFRVTANQTGKLVVNAIFAHDEGNLDLRIVDGYGNTIAESTASSSGNDNEQLVVPVVKQEVYYVQVSGADEETNTYTLEIENFATPVPDEVILDRRDDSGSSNTDNVTSVEDARIIIEADLDEFAREGIDILDNAEIANDEPGAAVQVFVNGNAVGYAEPIAGTGNTLFEFTFTPGDLSTAVFPVGGGGGENLVKAAVRIFDGQANVEGVPDPEDGRTQLSEPLRLVLDTAAPSVSAPDLLDTSDSGVSYTDDITDIIAPGFWGTAEPNTTVRLFANGVQVGQGTVGSDSTYGGFDQLGAWEVTVEPLQYGRFQVWAEAEDLAGNIAASSSLTVVVDPYEPNDAIEDATILGSLPEITVNDVLLHDAADVDLWKITADDTGKLIVNAFSQDDIGLRVFDAAGNEIAVGQESNVAGNLDVDGLVIPVVTQQEYFIEVTFDGTPPDPEEQLVQHVAIYDLEIENFAAPVPHAPELPAKDRNEFLNDTGVSQTDDLTFRTDPEIIIEADLAEFYAEGIAILSPSAFDDTDLSVDGSVIPQGAAVEVFVNGNSVGYATEIAGTGHTKFGYTFEVGELPDQIFHDDSGGWLHNVKAAVRIFDGRDAQADGRTQLSEPLELVVDDAVPAAPSRPDLLETSDDGTDNFDNLTSINQPAFQGTAEHNGHIRVYANGVLVGEGTVGTDLTDGGLDQIGHWEVTVEPLKRGQFEITATVEDRAGNISPASEPLTIVVDPYEPNDTLENAIILGSVPEITINEIFLHDSDDVDLFKYTANDTGKLIVNAFSQDDVSLRVIDAGGNEIAVGQESNVAGSLYLDGLVIPVVTQQEYFIEVTYNGMVPDPEEGPVQHVAVYDLEIENFAAPLPHAPELPAKDRNEILNDTGVSQTDDITARAQPEIIIEADLAEFFDEGIVILSPSATDDTDLSPAGLGVAPGAAVEVFVNGNSVGYATEIASTGHTKFRYTFENGELPDQIFHDDSGGWLHNVKAAVRIFDGQDAQADGRTQLSEPLELVVDAEAPPAAQVTFDLLASSDSGIFDDDNVTNVRTPAFEGTAEHNSTVRIFANGELVGIGTTGTDLTDDGFDQVGHWEITIEPLVDGAYDLTFEVEDRAGNITFIDPDLNPDILGDADIWIDTLVPNTPYLDLVGLEGPNLGLEVSDTGRHDADNVTLDNTPTVTVTADDTFYGDGNHFWHDVMYRIYDRPDPAQEGGTANNGEVLLVDSWMNLSGLTEDGFFNHTLSQVLNSSAGAALLDGVHNLKLEVEDRAGNISPDFLLSVTIDTVAPPITITGIDPAATDTGIEDQPDTFVDRITSDTATGFVGRAEADSIVRLYVDPSSDNAIGFTDEFALTVAVPYDGNQALPNGQWQTPFVRDLNDPNFFAAIDGVREVGATAEDLAGNVSEPEFLDIFIDTRGPQVEEVNITGEEDFNLFDHKDEPDGTLVPTPLVHSLDIDFIDRPERVGASFVYPAVNEILATSAGNYLLIGDANGVIPIASIEFLDYTTAGDAGKTTVRLHFDEPLPDDRFTLTISDRIRDDAGNALDGETDAVEPHEVPTLPSGDGVPGEDFVARFTVDSRPEIGVWADESVWIDTNGNFYFDPANEDYTNRDIVYHYEARSSDEVFAGNFSPVGAGSVADGFDKLAVYWKEYSDFFWHIDTDNDGVFDIYVDDPMNINGYPVAGDFDNNPANGDEVGVFAPGALWVDTNHDYRLDTSYATPLVGYPVVGDFDGDGKDDLGTYADDQFRFDLAYNGWGQQDAVINTLSVSGARERPVAADMDADGIDDIGLWAPDRTGASPEEVAEWYFLISNDPDEIWRQTGTVNRLNHDFEPIPFGRDMFAQYGDNDALPIVGNFDPPAVVDGNPMSSAPKIIGLAAADDAGNAGDGITDVRRPEIVGTADPGYTVVIEDGDVVLGQTVADSNGDFRFRPSTNLALGVHEIRARQADDPGKLSEPDMYQFTIVDECIVPTAMINYVSSGSAGPGETILLTGRGDDADGTIEEYLWESDLDGKLGTAASLSLDAAEATVGTHAVSLRVRDEDGQWSQTVSVTLIIEDGAPTASWSGVPTGTMPSGATILITLGGDDADEDGRNIAGGVLRLDGAVVPAPEMESVSLCIPEEPGDHTLSWQVQDDEGTWSAPISTTFAVAAPGDLNLDGRVTSDDLNVIRSYWGWEVTPGDLAFGDANGDGTINSDDLDVVRANWGNETPAADVQAPSSSDLDSSAPFIGPRRAPAVAAVFGALSETQSSHGLSDADFASLAEAAWLRELEGMRSKAKRNRASSNVLNELVLASE